MRQTVLQKFPLYRQFCFEHKFYLCSSKKLLEIFKPKEFLPGGLYGETLFSFPISSKVTIMVMRDIKSRNQIGNNCGNAQQNLNKIKNHSIYTSQNLKTFQHSYNYQQFGTLKYVWLENGWFLCLNPIMKLFPISVSHQNRFYHHHNLNSQPSGYYPKGM